MKYKCLIGVGIVSVILTGCKADTPANINSATNEIQRSQSAEQNNKPAPSEAQSNATATIAIEENKKNDIKLPDELLIDGWTVGSSFSSLVDKLPNDAQIDNSFAEYTITTNGQKLIFSDNGDLTYIFTDSPGKGLSLGLNVGDDESKITSILGTPGKSFQTKDGYLAYSYFNEAYELNVFTKDKIIQGFSMQYNGRASATDKELISKYYSNYVAAKNPKQPEKPEVAEQPKQQTQNNKTPKTKSNEQQKVMVKYATRDELIALRNDFFNRYKTLLGVISDDSSNTEKITAVFSDIDFNQVELDLEKASPHWSSKDKTLGRLVTDFVEAALDVYQWQIIKNNSDDNQIRVNAAYQIRDAAVKAQNANQKILVIINSKE
ncbi:hypothetical protein ABE205_07365 [Brevibacillus agri]|uniref:hypothetical protein n=1 Tax=Paenibacillaceae TaxID=186822 RepID=UPI0002A4D780|nr:MULTISPECIES: hypothetical protein [Paenibacillaceae]ELK43453.1 hypothetical protein D478_02967 [Brevibacillus agri BAB-2500]MCM3622757.1 hypothetical protein [Brevibacillus borstelensis]